MTATASTTERPSRLSEVRFDAIVTFTFPMVMPLASANSSIEATRPASLGLALVKFAEIDGSFADASCCLTCSRC